VVHHKILHFRHEENGYRLHKVVEEDVLKTLVVVALQQNDPTLYE
jgi:hypothetical protein